MSGLTSALDSALSGLEAFQTGISTVSNNVSNQTTPGYAVETVNPQTSAYGGSGQAGSGVIDPVAVQRASDQFAAARFNTATSASQGASTLSSALSAIDAALQGNGDVNGTAGTFFSGLSSLSSEPTNAAQAQTVMSNASGLANSFNAAASSLTQQQSSLSSTIGQDVASANGLLKQLATINKELQSSPSSNTLLDQQQAALNSLSSLVNVNTIPMQNGEIGINVQGVVLLDQSGAQTMSVIQGSPTQTPVVVAGTAKTPVPLNSMSGSIGGAMAGFSKTVAAQSSLDWFAGAVAGAVNQGQAEGLTASGQEGQPLFSVPSPTVTPAAGNTGTASLSATVTNAAALPSGGQGYVFSYGSSGWSASVPGTNQTYSLGSGPNLAVAGLAVVVSGTPNVGDQFKVSPETGAAASIALTTSNPSALAAADPYVATAGVVNPATGAVTNNNAGTTTEASDTVTATPSSSAAVVPPSYFGQTLTMKFSSPTAYSIVNASGATVSTGTWNGGTDVAIGYPSASKASGLYWQASLTGHPAAGDVVTLAPGGANSGSNAARLAAAWTSQSSTLPGGSLQNAGLGIVGTTGADASAAAAQVKSTAATVQTAQTTLSTVAGVNQDQQAVLMTQYQQAYQAAAQVITTSHAMFESLITAVAA